MRQGSSGSRGLCIPHPPTPPYVRFHIRRFMNDAEARGFDRAVTRELFYMFSRPTTASINCVDSGREFSFLIGMLDAPIPASRGFRPLPAVPAPVISDLPSASPLIAEIPGSFRSLTFRPSVRSADLLCPQLTSAHPSRRLSTPVARGRWTDLPG